MTGMRLRSEWLAHPLVLLVVGALTSSVLVPFITSRWQNHQKELELKTALVERVNQSTTAFLMSIQFAEMGARSQTQEDFDRAYRDWEMARAVIGSNLERTSQGLPLRRIGRLSRRLQLISTHSPESQIPQVEVSN